MSPDSTPHELAKKTAPIFSVLSGLATLALLQALDALHLWVLAILTGMLTEAVSYFIIQWSVQKSLDRQVQDFSEVLAKTDNGKKKPV